MEKEEFLDNRYAFEWFMKSEDESYWRRTQELVKRKTKKLAVIAGTSAIISAVAVIVSVFALMHSF